MSTISKLTQLCGHADGLVRFSLCGLANPGEHRRVPRRFADHEQVKAKLIEDKEVSGLAVNVETFKGVVQLSGFAKTEAERQKAAQLARWSAASRTSRTTSGSSEAGEAAPFVVDL